MGGPAVDTQTVSQQAHAQRQSYSAVPAASVVVLMAMTMMMMAMAPPGPYRTCGKRPQQHKCDTYRYHLFHSRLHSMMFHHGNGPAGFLYGYVDITHRCRFWLSYP